MKKTYLLKCFKSTRIYYVFLGAAENLEATKELALLYKTHDIDVFWKEIDFTTKLEKENQEIDKILAAYSSLAELSAAQLLNGTSNVEVNQVKAQLNEVQSSEYKETLNEAADLLQNNKPSEAQEKLLTFLQMITE